MDCWRDTIEGLNLIVEWAGVSAQKIALCCWCLFVMKHDHDGGDEKEIWELEAAEDEKEEVWPKECGRVTGPELRNERSQKWEKESRAEEVMIE